MEVLGTIKAIEQEQTFGTFTKRSVIVTTDEQYPQTILIEFVQDKCSLLDKFKVGQGVKIGINLRGREWVNPQGETKYFNSIQGWRIDSFITEDAKEQLQQPLQTQGQKEALEDLPF